MKRVGPREKPGEKRRRIECRTAALPAEMWVIVASRGYKTVLSQINRWMCEVVSVVSTPRDRPMQLALDLGTWARTSYPQTLTEYIADISVAETTLGDIECGLKWSGVNAAAVQFSDPSETILNIIMGSFLMIGLSVSCVPAEMVRSARVVNPAYRAFVTTWIQRDACDTPVEESRVGPRSCSCDEHTGCVECLRDCGGDDEWIGDCDSGRGHRGCMRRCNMNLLGGSVRLAIDAITASGIAAKIYLRGDIRRCEVESTAVDNMLAASDKSTAATIDDLYVYLIAYWEYYLRRWGL